MFGLAVGVRVRLRIRFRVRVGIKVKDAIGYETRVRKVWEYEILQGSYSVSFQTFRIQPFRIPMAFRAVGVFNLDPNHDSSPDPNPNPRYIWAY